MKWRHGPRPWTINLFAFLLFGSSLVGLIWSLMTIDQTVELLKIDFPAFAWDRDAAIVWSFSLFSIVLFPLVWIWGLGSRIARIVITVLAIPAALKLTGFVWLLVTRGVFDPLGLLDTLVVLVAVGLLFAPSASQWLGKEEVDPETFA